MQTQFNSVNLPVMGSGKLSQAALVVNNNHASHTNNKATIGKRDSFVHSESMSKVTYTPKTAYSTTNTADTDVLRKKIPQLLAAKMAGLSSYSNGNPIISNAMDRRKYEIAMDTIKGNHEGISYKEEYCYSQTGYDYGYTNALSSCATYALATALSIKNDTAITPDQISTNSKTDGHGTRWGNHGAYSISASESETLLAVDAQLQLGNPVLIHATGSDSKGNPSEHWATVIGKKDGNYTIIDPYYGSVCSLDEMQIYKNNGKLTGYVILSNEY